MKLFSILSKLLSVIGRWLRATPNVSQFAFIIAGAVMVLLQFNGYVEHSLPPDVVDLTELPKGWVPPPLASAVLVYILAFTRILLWLLSIVYFLVVFRSLPDTRKLVVPTWAAAISLTLWFVADSLHDRWDAALLDSIGEHFSITAYVIQLGLLVIMFMSPPIALTYYRNCKIMERYVMASFLQPLIFCLLGFLSLWVVMDLKDNLAQFQENHIPMRQIMVFYLKLLPFIYVSVAPVTLLLATLYSLGKMSRANELISMMGAGKSMGQVLRPIFIVGIYAAFVSVAANYEWAPTAEGNKKTLLQDVNDKVNKNIMSLAVVYKNNEDHRTWFLGMVPYDLRHDPFRRVVVREDDAEGHLVRAIDAKTASWTNNGDWVFFTGVIIHYDQEGTPSSIETFESLPDSGGKSHFRVSDWSETPWVLLSGSVTPEFLGVPDLLSYLNANGHYSGKKLAPFRTHFFYRFAMPLQCLVIVLIAAPLGVAYSRRGLLGGVASSVFIFFILLFVDSLFLNMGKGSRMPPWLAPFMPHVLLGTVGSILFYFRSQNRDFPKLNSIRSLWDAAKFLAAGLVDAVGRLFFRKGNKALATGRGA